jgi:hypothetical protein
MKLPQFTAEASLGRPAGIYRGSAVSGRPVPYRTGAVTPQLRIQSDPDLGAYLRCRANGGSELICRFFGGLPPFTIGGLIGV